jgi:hypothetical protein
MGIPWILVMVVGVTGLLGERAAAKGEISGVGRQAQAQ